MEVKFWQDCGSASHLCVSGSSFPLVCGSGSSSKGCEAATTDLPNGLGSNLSLHDQPQPSCWPLKLLSFDVNAYPDPAFHADADLTARNKVDPVPQPSFLVIGDKSVIALDFNPIHGNVQSLCFCDAKNSDDFFRQDEFEKFGMVTDVYNTGKGFAFVTFDRKENAETATMAMDGQTLGGQQIKVSPFDQSYIMDLN